MQFSSIGQSIMHQSRDRLTQCAIDTFTASSNVMCRYSTVQYCAVHSTVSCGCQPGQARRESVAGQPATTNRRNRFRLIQPALTQKRESDRQRHLAERVSSRDTRKEKQKPYNLHLKTKWTPRSLSKRGGAMVGCCQSICVVITKLGVFSLGNSQV